MQQLFFPLINRKSSEPEAGETGEERKEADEGKVCAAAEEVILAFHLPAIMAQSVPSILCDELLHVRE